MMEEHADPMGPAQWIGPTPLVESFHVAMWYVLRHFGGVVDAAHLLSWRTLLEVPVRTAPNSSTSIDFAEELELLLRLALQKPTWLRVRALEEKYAEQLHVGPSLRRLAALPVPAGADGEKQEISQDEMLLCIIDGSVVAQLVAAADETARKILSTARVTELRQLARICPPHRRDDRGRREKKGGDDDNNIDEDNNPKSSDGGSDAERVVDACASGGLPSLTMKRTSKTLPSRKEELIDFILSTGCTAVSFASVWDTFVGPLCRVHPQFKAGAVHISELLHVFTYPCGAGGVLGTMDSAGPVRPPSAALLLLASRLAPHHKACGVKLPSLPWWNGFAAGEDPLPASSPLCLFLSPVVLESYMEALHLHQQLVEASEGKSRRRWHLTFATTSHEIIENGLAQLQEYQRLSTSIDTKESMAHKRRRREEEEEEQGVISVEAMLRRGGLLYEHLLPFLPKHAWFACAEMLVPVLQYNKKWELANRWLRMMLEQPVHVVRSACGAITLPLYYRCHKRGKWWHRIAQNLVHLGDKKAALDILELQQQIWRQQHSPQHYIQAEEAKNLPVPVQRRARLLCALFPSVKATNQKLQKNIALYNAVGEYHRQRFCRRADRIAIEGTIAYLHRSLHRWTPFPPSRKRFTSQLLSAREVTVHAARDPEDATLWRDPHHTLSSCRVEEHVLRWFVAGRKSDGGWAGLHCEGRWIASLARILLWDAYVWDPDAEGEKEAGCMTLDAGAPALIWLSPLQNGPLDLTSTIEFARRRRHIIEERLRFFEECPRDTLIDYVKQRCRLGNELSGVATSTRDALDDGEKSPHGSGSEASLLASEDDGIVLPGQRTPPQRNKWQAEWASFSSCYSSAWHLVDVGDLPLLSLLQAVPQRPLCALLRSIYLSQPEEGYSIRFSGFPDLVLWREVPSILGDTSFKLVEVKSPNDTLSEAQIAVIDTLCRCGFDVSVARVTDGAEGARQKCRRSGNHIDSDHAQDVVLLDG
ncbi:hypothetical protein DQ04_02621030 [Trypanosoma grayi]|uniref:hypothetical protein n=1 Tax=Trypanosoma grayi TaxID=71804 RepID=UPI0004F48E68|nr:hypothetical protein DQ04_02621030 [Trypanosoma grayi]KEG11436.1 hypothetical protein DQ04_02621030 [Trypanosoma grayi]